MYGKELILDMHNCNLDSMTKESIENFLKKLCKLIDMERCGLHWWEEEFISKEELEAHPHLVGISCCQFIKTSSITMHAITGLGQVYLNIFSCKDFDARLAEGFSIGYFEGDKKNCSVIDRI